MAVSVSVEFPLSSTVEETTGLGCNRRLYTYRITQTDLKGKLQVVKNIKTTNTIYNYIQEV